MKKLAIVTTHPIQYYAPVFQLLHQNQKIEIKVFYTWGEASVKKHDPGFDRTIDWDIPVLEGYPYQWVKNTAKKPGSHHFKGIINPELIPQLKLWQPDIILVFGWAYQSHLKVLRYFKNKIPVYFRGDSTLLDDKPGIKLFLKSIFLKWVYKHVDHAFFVGTNNKAYFKKYGLKDTALSFAPHAIDNKRFSLNRKQEAQRLRISLGINDDEIVVLFAGKLEEKKSPLLLLSAFLMLNAPKTHLLFAGNGELEIQLRKKAADHQNVHFIDFQNQSFMPVVYQACDLFCLPSKGPGETWGLSVNEAMACRKPILVADKCGCAIDLVKPDNGIIFQSGNSDELVAALKKLVDDTELLYNYGRESEKRIATWNFDQIAEAIEAKLLPEKLRN